MLFLAERGESVYVKARVREGRHREGCVLGERKEKEKRGRGEDACGFERVCL